MQVRTILLAIVVVVILYVLYSYYASSNSTTLVKMHDARTLQVINANKLPAGSTADYTYSIWFYINDWNYRFGETKVIFGRVDQNNDPAPSVTLAPSNNNLTVTLATYPTTSTNPTPATMHSCTIDDVPIQKWTNLIMSLNNKALDLYLDGKLVRTCILPGVPKMNPSSNVLVCPSGGFSGFVSNFQYIANAINPSQAYDIYKDGFGGGSMVGGIFNKYRLKVGFVEDNREVNSFEL